MEPQTYKKIWQQEDPLYKLNHRLHDGVKPDGLAARAEDRVERFFTRHFPQACPAPGARVLELGSGVGWIMQGMLERFPEIGQVIGLDISANCIRRAIQRWPEPKAAFILYDGQTIPLADHSIDTIYSVSCLQHIEKHAAFLILAELFRILKPGGHATLHLLDIRHITSARHDYFSYCRDYVTGRENMHRLYFYTEEELALLLGKLIGVKGLQIEREGTSLLVYFTK